MCRRRLAVPGRPEVYELTEWGYRLEAVNAALSLWAAASPTLPRDADMSPDSLVLAMRAHARRVPGVTAGQRVALHLTDSRRGDGDPASYLARISRQRTRIDKSMEPAPVDAEVSATTLDWKAWMVGGVDAEQLPNIRISGQRTAVDNLIVATSLTPPGRGLARQRGS